MQRRFTIIEGGLAKGRGMPATRETPADGHWRVIVRTARTIEENEIADWRALAARNPNGPFADPDFLLTAARHDPKGAVIFALAYAGDVGGQRSLGAVLPLEPPHPMQRDSTIRLWQPVLAPEPVEPTVEAGIAPAALEAVVAHCVGRRSSSGLLLSRIQRDGALLHGIASDARLRVELIDRHAAIPAENFVEVHPRLPAPEIERVTDPEAIRDAVERFLLLNARRSRNRLLDDPSTASVVRVATRLFARRDMACVELGRVRGEIVSAAIRLGGPDARVLWRSVDVFEAAAATMPTVDAMIGLASDRKTAPRPDRVSLVAS